MRLTTLRAALRPTTIATPLVAPALAALLGCVPILIAEPRQLPGGLVGAALVTSFGVGFVLDDPAAVTLEASPTSLAGRRLPRLALLAVVLVVGVGGQLLLAHERAGGAGLPIRSWLVEMLAFVTVTLAASAVAQRHLPGRLGGAAAAPTGFILLALVGVQAQLWHWLQPLPGAPDAHRWWYVVAAATVLVAWSSRDPATRSTLASRHGRRGNRGATRGAGVRAG